MSVDLKTLNDKFFTDPDWSMMEELLLSYIEPFRSVLDIPSNLSNDQIATEVRGRQKMIEQIERFLVDTKVVREKIKSGKPSYK